VNYNGVRIKRRKYRLNIRKISIFLSMLVGIITIIVLVTGSKDGAVANAGTNSTTPGDRAQYIDPEDSQNAPIIVLDAGHGGFDPGTAGVSGTREDVLNLEITQRLKNLLEQDGVRVIMTREDENALASNKDDDMAARSRIIEQSGADIVVSIHMNWYEDPDMSGPTVLFIPGSTDGRRLAEVVQDSMNTELNADGIARSEDFLVLRSGDQPSIMVECGYISNAEEEAKLKQADYQQKVAEAIYEGIQEYMNQSGNE